MYPSRPNAIIIGSPESVFVSLHMSIGMRLTPLWSGVHRCASYSSRMSALLHLRQRTVLLLVVESTVKHPVFIFVVEG
jgi:hypothetical protein